MVQTMREKSEERFPGFYDRFKELAKQEKVTPVSVATTSAQLPVRVQ